MSELIDLAAAAVNAMSESAADKRADEAAQVLPEAKRIATEARERAQAKRERKAARYAKETTNDE